MARRTISTQGRVLAAALCVGITGALAGLMAATDDTGSASADTGDRGVDRGSDVDVDGRFGDEGFGDASPSGGAGTQPFFPQPQTRTGGS